MPKSRYIFASTQDALGYLAQRQLHEREFYLDMPKDKTDKENPNIVLRKFPVAFYMDLDMKGGDDWKGFVIQPWKDIQRALVHYVNQTHQKLNQGKAAPEWQESAVVFRADKPTVEQLEARLPIMKKIRAKLNIKKVKPFSAHIHTTKDETSEHKFWFKDRDQLGKFLGTMQSLIEQDYDDEDFSAIARVLAHKVQKEGKFVFKHMVDQAALYDAEVVKVSTKESSQRTDQESETVCKTGGGQDSGTRCN